MLLLEKLKEYHIILASASPRRVELMKGAGFSFEQCVGYAVDESYPAAMSWNQVAEFLAVKKSEAYTRGLSEKDLLIAADTIVVVDNQILGKPEHADDAKSMLQKLSNKTHHVLTGVCIRTYNTQVSFTGISQVGFRKLSSEEIDYYVDNFSPLDKAGAYGIQEWIGYVGINKIEGSYFNVVGLPIQQIFVELGHLIC